MLGGHPGSFFDAGIVSRLGKDVLKRVLLRKMAALDCLLVKGSALTQKLINADADMEK